MTDQHGKLQWLLPDSNELNSLAADRGLLAEFHAVNSLGSTQDYLQQLPAAELSHGLTIVADYQSAGHGRHERSWQAVSGSALLMSTVVALAAPEPLLPVAAGLAALDAVVPFVSQASLKWPNDIVVPVDEAEPFKLGGIVISVRPAGSGWFALIGIGINIDMPAADRPTSLARALHDFSESRVQRNQLAVDVVANLHSRLEHQAQLLADYQQNCCTIGQAVVATLHSGPPLTGRAIGIDAEAGLVVATTGGQQSLRAADVVHVRRN